MLCFVLLCFAPVYYVLLRFTLLNGVMCVRYPRDYCSLAVFYCSFVFWVFVLVLVVHDCFLGCYAWSWAL